MFITHLLFNVRKNFHISQIKGIAFFWLLGLGSLVFLLHIESSSAYCYLLCSLTVLSVFYFWAQYRLIKRNVESKKYIMISNDSKMNYSVLNKYYGHVLFVGLILPIVLALLFFFNKVNISQIQLIIILLLIFMTFIKAFKIDMIVIFSERDFFSGNTRYSYSEISRLDIVRELSLSHENVIGFEIYNNERYMGFDKFRDSDFRYLKKKLDLIK